MFDLIWDQSGSHITVVWYLIQIGIHSHIELIWHGSGSFDMSFSGAFSGLLDVIYMLGKVVFLNCGMQSLVLLRVCLSIHL